LSPKSPEWMDGSLPGLHANTIPTAGYCKCPAENGHASAAKGVPHGMLLPKLFAPAQLVEAVSSLLNRSR
jgi:hypothetical protein